MKDAARSWNAVYGSSYGRRYPFEPLVVYVQRLKARGFAGQRALDIGFGTIADMLMLHNAGYHIHGLEVAENAIARAHTMLEEAGVPNALAHWEPGVLFPYKDGLFDLVISIGALHYNINQDAVLSEMARVMRSGGRFMITYPAPGFHYWRYSEVIAPNVRRYVEGYPNKNMVGVEFMAFESEQEVQVLYDRHFDDVDVSLYHYRLLDQNTSFWLVTGTAS